MTQAPRHETPPPKMETVTFEDRKARDKQEKNIDKQVEQSFPASDSPSYNAGDAVGAPVSRESEPAKPGDEAVKEAEQKVKAGDAAKPETY